MKSISERLFRISRKKKIPLIVNFEVTHQCNLNCIHCYHLKKKINEELTYEQIKKILISLRDAGTMFLIITGGEPFFRKDILYILKQAKELNFSIIIFTNGTLITQEIAKFISGIVPFSVHISLYSVKEKVHERITGKPGSFEKTMKGIQLLQNNGVNPVIKCPVMNENINSIDELRAWADREGLQIKIDPFIAPCYKNNAIEITLHRLPVEMINKTIINKGLYNINDFKPRENMECFASKNMAGIDACGNVYPCIVWREKFGNIIKEEFKDVFKNMNPDYNWLEECKDCENLPFCGICPGVAKVEGKEVFCRMAENVRKVIEKAV